MVDDVEALVTHIAAKRIVMDDAWEQLIAARNQQKLAAEKHQQCQDELAAAMRAFDERMQEIAKRSREARDAPAALLDRSPE